MKKPNLRKTHILAGHTVASSMLWLSFGVISLFAVVTLIVLGYPLLILFGLCSAIALILLTVAFFDGMPTKSVALLSLIAGVCAYAFLDKNTWGTDDFLLKSIQKLGLLYGAIFGGALLGMVHGKEIILKYKHALGDPHKTLRVRSGVFLAMGLVMLASEEMVGEAVLRPGCHAVGEFFVAVGIGLFIESRALVFELLHDRKK